MSDLLHQNLSTVQSDKNDQPTTIVAAATISPVHKFTRITGTTPITKINPPVSGYHELTFVFTTATAGHLATGGVAPGAVHAAYTSIADRPVTLYYDPRTKLYYVGTVA